MTSDSRVGSFHPSIRTSFSVIIVLGSLLGIVLLISGVCIVLRRRRRHARRHLLDAGGFVPFPFAFDDEEVIGFPRMFTLTSTYDSEESASAKQRFKRLFGISSTKPAARKTRKASEHLAWKSLENLGLTVPPTPSFGLIPASIQGIEAWFKLYGEKTAPQPVYHKLCRGYHSRDDDRKFCALTISAANVAHTRSKKQEGPLQSLPSCVVNTKPPTFPSEVAPCPDNSFESFLAPGLPLVSNTCDGFGQPAGHRANRIQYSQVAKSIAQGNYNPTVPPTPYSNINPYKSFPNGCERGDREPHDHDQRFGRGHGDRPQRRPKPPPLRPSVRQRSPTDIEIVHIPVELDDVHEREILGEDSESDESEDSMSDTPLFSQLNQIALPTSNVRWGSTQEFGVSPLSASSVQSDSLFTSSTKAYGIPPTPLRPTFLRSALKKADKVDDKYKGGGIVGNAW